MALQRKIKQSISDGTKQRVKTTKTRFACFGANKKKMGKEADPLFPPGAEKKVWAKQKILPASRHWPGVCDCQHFCIADPR